MSFSAVVTMIIILTVVWGGFIFLLRLAMKKESQKAGSTENEL